MTAFAVHFSGSWSVGVLFKRNCSIDWPTKRWPLRKTMHKTWHHHYYIFFMKVLTWTLFLWYVQSIQSTNTDVSSTVKKPMNVNEYIGIASFQLMKKNWVRKKTKSQFSRLIYSLGGLKLQRQVLNLLAR